MPTCGCFHSYKLTALGDGSYDLRFSLEGQVDLKRLFEDSGLALSVDHLRPEFPLYPTGIRLSGVTEEYQLGTFCDYLKSTIILNLAPSLDHCYALGPYTLFSNSVGSHSEIGELVHQAKYQRDREAADDLMTRLQEFIDSHPILSSATAIAVPPKSAPSPQDLPLEWAKSLAPDFGFSLIQANKARHTEPQKNIAESDTEEQVVARIQGSISVIEVPPGSRVLILDDTIRSGGTLIELARALRQAGAERVYALAAAKDARFTNGGIDLDREAWT